MNFKIWIRSLAVLFAVPLVTIALIPWLQSHSDAKILNFLEKSVHGARDITEQERQKAFQELKLAVTQGLCNETAVHYPGLLGRSWFDNACRDRGFMELAVQLAYAMIVLGVLHILLALAFAVAAKRSRGALIGAFKAGWTVSIVLALLILLGQTFLITADLFFTTSTLTSRYQLHLMLFFLLGTATALYLIVRALFTPVPFETGEAACEPVSEDQAPRLWAAVRRAASKLGTEVPDQILLGVSENFFVTEAAVHHSAGKA
ncbi:MAG TPA: hypothetical protein VFV50_00540, partial [Bdellovibrionales bacterium]|nr:hypothetical protein [Bdellovibrionales bacterium]